MLTLNKLVAKPSWQLLVPSAGDMPVFLWCSARDVQQLKSILCMPSLNPDIRRAAADQLLSLAPDPRFAQSLSDMTVLHTLLGELTSTDSGLGCSDEFAEATEPNEAEEGQLLHERLPGCANAQLPISCLHLLVALVQHCSEAKALLLEGADRSADRLD